MVVPSQTGSGHDQTGQHQHAPCAKSIEKDPAWNGGENVSEWPGPKDQSHQAIANAKLGTDRGDEGSHGRDSEPEAKVHKPDAEQNKQPNSPGLGID